MCVRERGASGLEVLLLRRNTELQFASGFWVFPGGKIEDSDHINATRSEDMVTLAAENAAKREAHEEAGLVLEKNQLDYFWKWTTPAPSVKRFETWFFVTQLSDGQIDVIIDDSEIKDYIWLTPQSAINELGSNDVKLLPPTFLALNRIKSCTSYIDARSELLKTTHLNVRPRTGMIDGVFQSMYPGDAGYESHNVHQSGARHRLSGDLKRGTYKFEYHGCDDHFPLNGGYDW